MFNLNNKKRKNKEEEPIVYTYDNPRIVSNQTQDYLVRPEIYRRYSNQIIFWSCVFIPLSLTIFSFSLDFIVGYFFDRTFSFFKLVKFFVGDYDSENKILYGLMLALIGLIIYKPTSKMIYSKTKPIKRASITEGLILIEGKNVFDELEEAFDDMFNQD